MNDSYLLPKDAVNILKNATATPISKNDPLARVRAVELAISKVRRLYPQHFKKDGVCYEESISEC